MFSALAAGSHSSAGTLATISHWRLRSASLGANAGRKASQKQGYIDSTHVHTFHLEELIHSW